MPRFYAACESGHGFWEGSVRDDFQTAQDDATAHDQSAHGGSATAVVLPSSLSDNEILSLVERTDAEPRIAASVRGCVSLFSAGIDKVGIRNNCDHCAVAVVSWQPKVGVKRYRVEGYKEVIIRIEDQVGQLIGEDPCSG